MRSLGIPITMDFYEMSPSYNSRHFWSALIDTTGLVVPFNYIEREIVRRPQEERKKGKVYRTCYGIQPEKYSGLYTDKEVPAFFRRPFMKVMSISQRVTSSWKVMKLLINIGGICVYLQGQNYNR